jgi:hypothetical protein
MIEVQSDKWDAVGEAIKAALKTSVTVDGHSLYYATLDYKGQEVETAVALALMSLVNSYVRPKGLQFMTGFGTDKEKVF